MVALPRLLAGIFLLSLLAGCAQKGADTPAEGSQVIANGATEEALVWAAHPQVTLAPGQEPVRARFAYAGPLNVTKTLSGAFAPQEFCLFGACTTQQQVAFLDLSGSLPVGLPLRVTAELATAYLFSAPSIFLSGPAENRLDEGDADFTDEGARAVFSLQRNVDGPVLLGVRRGEPGDGTFAYTLTLTVEVLASHFDARTPVAVQVPAGAAAIAVEASTPGGDVRVWDAKDAYLGNHSLAKGFALIPVQQAGEHVLQFSGATAALQVHVLAPRGSAPPLLRALGFSRTFGEVRDATGATPVEWTFDVDGVPLGVGIAMANPEATYVMTQLGADFQLRDARGLLVSRIEAETCICGLRLTAGAWGSQAPAGTYTASHTSTGSAQAQLSHFVDRYAR